MSKYAVKCRDGWVDPVAYDTRDEAEKRSQLWGTASCGPHEVVEVES